MKEKPNLFIPGAAKSGTSSLHEYLNLHPDILMSSIKEPHFFSHDSKYNDPVERENYYSLFLSDQPYKIKGESSTGYMVFQNSLDRILREIENPKFIFLLRNPIDRIFSHYNWVNSQVGELNSFKNAVVSSFKDEPDHKDNFGNGYRFYFQFGLYAKWLKQFYHKVDKDQILILFTENLKTNPLQSLNQCFRFLEVDELKELPQVKVNETVHFKNSATRSVLMKLLDKNRGGYERLREFDPRVVKFLGSMRRKIIQRVNNAMVSNSSPELSMEDRQWLAKLYEEDVEELRKLIGFNCLPWSDFKDKESSRLN